RQFKLTIMRQTRYGLFMSVACLRVDGHGAGRTMLCGVCCCLAHDRKRVIPMSEHAVEELAQSWKHETRWEGITRPYSAEDVVRLRGTVQIEHTLARMGAERLWKLLNTESFVPALGALTGNQAMQMVKAGLKAIYLSGWQVAADANLAGQMYPDQSLYPS